MGVQSQDKPCLGKCAAPFSVGNILISISTPLVLFLYLHTAHNDLQTSNLKRKLSARTYKGLEVPNLISHLPFGKENSLEKLAMQLG